MIDAVHRRYEQLHVSTLLGNYSGLRIVPSRSKELVIKGTLQFTVAGPINQIITDQYEVELRIPLGFPHDEPTVRELGGRIPRAYHKLDNGCLCLGAPTAIRLKLRQSPTLPAFVERLLIPYLYGYSCYEQNGIMPYGELAHGHTGIRQHLAALLNAPYSDHPEEFLRLAGMNKRVANKRPCPCGSGRRLGHCHNRRVNYLRQTAGRKWLHSEYLRVIKLLEINSLYTRLVNKRGVNLATRSI